VVDRSINYEYQKQTVESFHKSGENYVDKCGMARNEAGLKQALPKFSN
jgi:hypothetical protein